LQSFFKSQYGLRGHGRPQGGNGPGPITPLEPIDAGPFANVVAIGAIGLEKALLESGQRRGFTLVGLSIIVGRHKGNVEAGVGI
jgi:hypothetical protein